MLEARSTSSQPLRAQLSLPWRGLAALAILFVVGAIGSDIIPTGKRPEINHYIPAIVLLALSVGFGLSAVRSRQRAERPLGIAVLTVGCGMVAYIAWIYLGIIN